MPLRRFRRWAATVTALTLLAVPALFALPAGADEAPTRTLDPIGGGYSTTTVTAFVQTVIDHAQGSTVRILVVPSAYAHTSLGYAQQHVDSIQSTCVALLGSASGFGGGCDTELVPLWTRADAQNPANVAAIGNPETDGVFILGGDQDVAMEILAETPSEDAMAQDYARGVVFGGTSAGDAVESRNMLTDYANGGGPGTALQQDQILIWWGDDADPQRGLSFGSTSTILDQHFYQRGRFGRLLNAVAQSTDHVQGSGLLGVGVDFATSVHLTNDVALSDVTGSSSVAIVDFANASHQWLGPRQTLSARNVLTQIVPPDTCSYSIAGRSLYDCGVGPATTPAPWPPSTFAVPGSGTLFLAGDALAGGNVLTQFVTLAQGTGSNQIVLVVAGFPSTGDASSSANAYAQALKKLGWGGSSKQITILNVEDTTSWSRVQASVVDGAAGVIFVGGDQALIGRSLADATFQAVVREALNRAPVVLTDRAMTPAMGDFYVANADPTAKSVEGDAIAAFTADYADVEPGLGYLHAAFEPRLTADQRWGRLYGLAAGLQAAGHPEMVYGISEQTALRLNAGQATVVGERSVVALDGRTASFTTGSNGALGAFNVWLDLYAPGEAVSSP